MAIPNDNPADRAVERLNKATQEAMPKPRAREEYPRSRETEMLERIARLEDIIESLAGGTTDQILAKTSGTDYAFAWVDKPDVDAAQAAADLANAKIDGATISGSCSGGSITVIFTPGS